MTTTRRHLTSSKSTVPSSLSLFLSLFLSLTLLLCLILFSLSVSSPYPPLASLPLTLSLSHPPLSLPTPLSPLLISGIDGARPGLV